MRTNSALERVGAHPIAAIQQQVRDMRSAGIDLIDFSIGDPIEPTWEAIPAAVREAVPVTSQYPTTTGLPELRSAIAGYVRRRTGVDVDPDTQIIPTSGSKEAIFSTALSFVDRDRSDVVAYPDPAYPVYARGAAAAGAETVALPTDERFVLPVGAVPDALWERLVLLWLCTPSNPTGAVTPASDLEALIDAARSHDTLLCSDECYLDLYEPDREPPTSAIEVGGPDLDQMLVYLSLSKRSGMTGYRSGAIVGDRAAIAAITRLRTSTGTASPEFVQAGAIVAWNDDAHVAARRETFASKRQILSEFFQTRGVEIGGDRAGLYLWLGVGGDDVAVTERLLDAGVVVSPGSIFGERGRGWLRLALVPGVDECRLAVTALRDLF